MEIIPSISGTLQGYYIIYYLIGILAPDIYKKSSKELKRLSVPNSPFY